MRRRAKKENVGVALFPFLAVLICTMGALIVLLVMNVQQASVEAKTIAAQQAKANEPDPADVKKQQEALEEARWRQEVLEQQRKERQDKLQEARLALSHLEDHIRRLNAKGKELMELLEKVKAGKQSKEQDLEAARQELAKIKDELAKKKDELAKKKKDATAAEKWYALIPYDGPNGTRRMPIYIECVAEGIVIQPEGVLLTPDDFQGEPSPGNPLDAALRTKREYIMKATGGKAVEPYPLIVVRPSGVISYGAARSCMRFWEDEFGYELIAEDKKLDFGPRDPNLDQIMSREIAQARKRQAVMATAMPRKYREESPRSFAPEDIPEVQRRREAMAGNGVGNGGGGNGFGTGSGGTSAGGIGSSGTGPGGSGLSGSGGTGARGASSGGMAGMSGSGTGPYGSGGNSFASQDPGGVAGTGGTGAGTGGSGGTGPGGAGAGGSNPGGTANSGNPGSGKAGSPRLTQPNQGGNSPGAGSYADGTQGGTSESGGTSRPGSAGSQNNNQANAGGGTSSSGGASGGSSGGTSGGTPGGGGSTSSSSGGQSMPNIGVTTGSADKSSPSGSQRSGQGRGGSNKQAKGKNWGLPEAQRHISGVTRPIGVTILKDKLILQPERVDQRRPQVIPLSPEMSAKELETLVNGVQRHMRSWGIALDGGYWRPALSAEVQPGAEDRFAELQSALQGSGIEVQRKLR